MAGDSQKMPTGNFRLIHLVAILILVAVMGVTGWTYLQQNSLNNDIAAAEQAILDAEAQLVALQDSDVEALIIAQQTIEAVEVSTVWSEVITQLLTLTPLDVYYTSYSASRSSEMSLSVLATSYAAAADLLTILSGEEQFSDVFVSSLALGSSQDESEIVSFGVTFNVL